MPRCVVDGHQAPDVDAGALHPAVAGPRVVERLAGARHGVEGPHQLAVVDVPRAHVAGRALRRPFLRAAAGDDQVLVDDRRRAEAVVAGEPLQDLRRVQIDDALHAELVVRLAGHARRANRACRRSIRRRSAAGVCAIAAEVLDAARRRIAGRQREDPLLFPGRSGRARRRGRRASSRTSTPLMTSGVVSPDANPPAPPPRPPRPCGGPPAAGSAGGAAPAAAGGFMWYTHAGCSCATLAGVICVSGE